MNNNKKILRLILRFLFYGHFAVWSFIAGSSILKENSGNLPQDNEAYLIPGEYNSSLFSEKEYTDRSLDCPDSYFNTPRVSLFKLTGNYHMIKSGRTFIPNNKYIIKNLTRPPP